MNYKPNLDAVDIILKEINPLLLAEKNFKYKIIICGKNLPASYNELKDFSDKNIIYAGFVDDIALFFKAADIFINPVTDGGGIKTKLVEALGYNVSVISTANGAIGIPLTITGEKMKVLENDDWKKFAGKIIECNDASDIPPEFFDHFYWGNVAKKAAAAIA
ncbi:MAG: glycosyltransferase family 4 protein [Chitinophagaceae bacterium]|nr:glycosyltransferase family 4 protein [Chitinophagaceae bacterium]